MLDPAPARPLSACYAAGTGSHRTRPKRGSGSTWTGAIWERMPQLAPPKRSSTAGAQCFTQNGGTRGISGRVNWEQGPYPGVCGESCRHNRCGRCFQRSFCGWSDAREELRGECALRVGGRGYLRDAPWSAAIDAQRRRGGTLHQRTGSDAILSRGARSDALPNWRLCAVRRARATSRPFRLKFRNFGWHLASHRSKDSLTATGSNEPP